MFVPRPQKKPKAHKSGHTHRRARFDDDFQQVNRRVTQSSSRGIPLIRNRSPQRSRTRLNVNTNWNIAPDNVEYALDEDGRLYNEAVTSDIYTQHVVPPQTKKKYKRSIASVSVKFSSPSTLVLNSI
jgi:hypothetical protein